VPYNNQGILILLTSSYYDWGITTPGALTTWNNTVSGADITASNVIPATPNGQQIALLNDGVSPADGTGVSLQAQYSCLSAAVKGGGAGYVAGDVLTMAGGEPVDTDNTLDVSQATQILVTGVSAGAITAISLTQAGTYAGPVTGKSAVLPGGALFTGGSGAGAQFALTWQVLPGSVQVLNPGSGYSGGEVSHDTAKSTYTQISVVAPGASANITASSVIPATGDGSDITLTNTGISPADGTGLVMTVQYKAVAAGIVAAGTGYGIGDVLTLTGGSGVVTASSFTVLAIGAAGEVVLVGVNNAGGYTGPHTSSTATLPGGAHLTGGAGAGAKLGVSFTVDGSHGVTIVTPGVGYAGGEISNDTAVSLFTTLTLQSSGIIGGQAIAVYAGRVWLSNNRTVFVSEIDSYNNFGGSGTNFTVPESYLHGNITALCATSNYLYLFGQDSIDAISNVTVQSGVVAFSRINLITGVGTNSPSAVVGYFRGVFFQHATGFYLLAGASPERLSEKIQGLVRQITPTHLWACLVSLNGELCVVVNAFNLGLLLLYFKGRWFSVTLPGAPPASNYPIFSVPGGDQMTAGLAGLNTLYYFDNSISANLWRMFDTTVARLPWSASTKLWDAQAPLSEKQAITTAVAALNLLTPTSGVSVQIDTELASFGPNLFPAEVPSNSYALMVNQSPGGGGQYIGFTLSGDGLNAQTISLLALRAVVERDMLQ
jgi:hypothetical protein